MDETCLVQHLRGWLPGSSTRTRARCSCRSKRDYLLGWNHDFRFPVAAATPVPAAPPARVPIAAPFPPPAIAPITAPAAAPPPIFVALLLVWLLPVRW